eukprot:TRINITY_DN1547_c0_g1_i1.p1 TRINITY_DN1547_c0_g1~~TRINITY_DN1547_c0_g1_i1.p1  ORF type:complete len:104 (-),score=10.51 TRINITY_DN1547_c0_g1_i1:189-500(-)
MTAEITRKWTGEELAATVEPSLWFPFSIPPSVKEFRAHHNDYMQPSLALNGHGAIAHVVPMHRAASNSASRQLLNPLPRSISIRMLTSCDRPAEFCRTGLLNE